ncbi:NACHT domain- and WD repeat-containing protein 1-like [Pecten maximus]|uniref:NACHT domain- and WD repeat-containing protein 1-like n=1 Tax=Pecten maximus TaxID=6579 RepID=UPI0014590495|nr:NACHT domain- and WD repeat-containing protein 1-like [Pecten maximus]
MHERNKWMKRAYPELRSFCRMKGYDFQVVDMRWGVRDEASDDHTTEDLCMNELRLCQKLSTGPNFISLLANKYGYRPPPRTISVDHFNTLFGVVENDHHKTLLNKWYVRDDNALPPEFVLQPRSRILPDYRSKETELHNAAKAQSNEEIDIIKSALDKAARISLPEDEAEEYYVSSMYFLYYGIDPTNENHKTYLKKMTEEFISQTERLIEEGIKQRSATEITNPLILECCQHVSFCQQKCGNFCGRETTLANVEAYIRSTSTKPLIIHGASGCGKTSLMAMVARLIPSWMSNTNPAIVLRFIGTTPDSSNINGILISIIKQIQAIYNQTSHMPESLKELSKESALSLELASASQPLVIILDALDQIDVSFNARSLFWLPRTLSKHVKVIVSTIEDNECFPRLKVMFQEKEQFVPVPELTFSEAETIIQQWLRTRKRTLSPPQMAKLNECVRQCPLPLFLNLSFESASKWHSYWNDNETILQQTVKGSIEYLFSKMESKHGQMLVSRTIGYLTASKSGLSESELEDVLSCDDDVLNDVYQFWVPPVRRLPPLLLVRLKTDIQQYIVERGSDGISVLNWYHRQFKEAASEKYCTLQVANQIHRGLADFFNGKWAEERKKPYVGQNKSGEEDRHVASQPLINGDSYNLRRLNNAPYHMIKQGDATELKTKCLMNYEFLQAKVVATSVRHILDDFAIARKIFQNDLELDVLGAALEMSQGALLYDPLQLAPQLMDRLCGDEHTADLLRQCEQCSVPYLSPDQEVLTKPGGQLVYCMTGHSGPVKSVDIRDDGKLAVSCSDDDENSVKTWDLVEGKLHKSYDGIDEDPSRVRFVCNDQMILVDYENSYIVLRESGEVVFSINEGIGCQSAVGGIGKALLALFCDVTVHVYNLENGESVAKFENSDYSKQFCENMPSAIAASENYVVLTDADQHYITVFRFSDHTLSEWFEVFNPDRKRHHQTDLTIDAIVITPDEKQFILSNIRDNDLHIYDLLTREKLQSIKGFQSDYARNYRIADCGNLLYFPGDTSGVVVWNLAKKQRSCILTNSGDLCGAVCWSWKTMVTVADDDSTVCVWDLEKDEKEKKNQSPVLGHKVRHFLPLNNNARYVLVLAQTNRTDDDCCSLQVYDVQTKTVVRHIPLDVPFGVVKVLDDKRIVVVTRTRKMKIINIDSMTIDKVFEGDLSGYTLDVHVKHDGSEILTHTRGRQQFKRYDTRTGKTKAIIPRPSFVKKDNNNRFEKTFYVTFNISFFKKAKYLFRNL